MKFNCDFNQILIYATEITYQKYTEIKIRTGKLLLLSAVVFFGCEQPIDPVN